MKTFIWILLLAISILATAFITPAFYNNTKYDGNIYTNEEFIKGLYKPLNLNDSKEIFRYVFNNLNDEVTIYPTENYYYWKSTINGRIFKGCLCLFTHTRDSGKVNFHFLEELERTTVYNRELLQDAFTMDKKDGLILKKINDFKYEINFEGKTVCFNLNKIGIVPPKKAKLLKDETFVGPSFDESGIAFHLLFNKTTKHLYWILNEDIFQTETFTSYRKNIIIGDRTSFAFYHDTANNRKILIGVKGENVLNNNWYDGPFDQLPDNYVYSDSLKIKEYLELSYPQHKGKIDNYGHFLQNTGSRIPVGSYCIYFSLNELDRTVDSSMVKNLSPSDFYSGITNQFFVVPPKYYNAYYTTHKHRSVAGSRSSKK